MVYFSEIKNRPVLDEKEEEIGRLIDLAFIDGEEYGEVSHIIIKAKDGYRKKISWRYVREFREETNSKKLDIGIHLNVPLEDINMQFEKGDEFLVTKLIDKQIVDTKGLKVVRVNDILLGKISDKFCIVAVCVGAKSFSRRLGIEGFVRIFNKKIQEHIIPWKVVEQLEHKIYNIHIKEQRSKIAELHPSDIADIMEDLTFKERQLIFNSLDSEKAKKTLIEAEPNVQQSVFDNLKISRTIDILENVLPSQAADILSMMPKSKSKKLLSLMREDAAKKIKEILNYPEESAGALMHTSFVAVPKNYTAEDTISLLRKLRPSSERAYHLYVVDKKNHLLGVLSIRALLTASPRQKVSKIMRTDNLIKVKLDTPKEEIANAITKYNLFVLPVVDDSNVLKGVVSAEKVLTEVMPESWKNIKIKTKTTRKAS